MGEEAQVDFGYVGFMLDPISGVLRKTWAFVMTFSYSRHQYVESVFDQREAEVGQWGFSEFLGRLLEDEIERRAQRQLAQRIKKGGLNPALTLEGFDWNFNPRAS